EKQLDWGKRALAHELGHLVTHQITFSPYGAILPTEERSRVQIGIAFD
ncbi:unnamed protein product, partial [marine sediment metagenome]